MIASDRTTALGLSTDLGQAGATFNDATRLLDGGLWSQPADNNNQAAYLGMYTSDIHAVLNDINAALANPAGITVNGTAYTPSAADTAVLQQVQGQLQTLLNEAPLSVGNSHQAANAQELIHTTQTSILNEINGDATLAQTLAANPYQVNGASNVAFQNLPQGSDSSSALAAATTSGASLAQIGTVFNAAADLAVGGLNHSNLSQFNTDMQAVSTGLSNLLNNPTQLAAVEAGETPQAAALTTIHLDTLLNQANLQQSKFDGEYATNPNVAARSTNDNLLDMIDIVQGDNALAAAATANGTQGFGNFPSYLTGTIQKYQDNQAQTNFWAQFLSEANTINGQLQNVAAGNNTTPGEINSLINEIQNYQKFGASFDQSQGGIFGARFDNELLGGTLLTDTQSAVHGLQGIANGDTGAALAADQAQILAAGQGFVADAQDVSGNNVPVGGGSYVGTATTVAGATSPAGVAQGTIPVTGQASGATGLAQGQGSGAGEGHGVGHNGSVASGNGGAANFGGNGSLAGDGGLNGGATGAGSGHGGFESLTTLTNSSGATSAITTPASLGQATIGAESGTGNQGVPNIGGLSSMQSSLTDIHQQSGTSHHFELFWHH